MASDPNITRFSWTTDTGITITRSVEKSAHETESGVRRLIDGARVRAHLWNFDGRHTDVAGGVYPPDVADPLRVVVGELRIEEVDSVFGAYTRFSVIEDTGHINWVEEDTVEQIWED
ncbi:hypothetical protein [Gordonia iterans]